MVPSQLLEFGGELIESPTIVEIMVGVESQDPF